MEALRDSSLDMTTLTCFLWKAELVTVPDRLCEVPISRMEAVSSAKEMEENCIPF